jgi:hypothetical protein
VVDELVYIGQCSDFANRINLGYGNISPKNCYEGGQSTNCKINKMVLNAVKANKVVELYFYGTTDFDAVERELICSYKPEYNHALEEQTKYVRPGLPASERKDLSHVRTAEFSPTAITGCTESIREHINGLKRKAKENGQTECILVSGDIHKSMGLYNKMPSVCNAMYQLMKPSDVILSTTPSGKSSTIKIKYLLY